jgi:hypothetical protein
MQNIVEELIAGVLAGLLLLLIEYFVPKPNVDQKKKIAATIANALILVVLAFFPFIPLLLFQFLSAQLVAATMMQQPEVRRIEWYSNLYAVLALLWGWIWGTKARPWLRSKLERGR